MPFLLTSSKKFLKGLFIVAQSAVHAQYRMITLYQITSVLWYRLYRCVKPNAQSSTSRSLAQATAGPEC